MEASHPSTQKELSTRLQYFENTQQLKLRPTSRKLLNIYIALIRPKLGYGSIIYSSASDQLLQVLDPIQNTCLRLALRAFPTTPTSSLHSLSGIQPLSYRRLTLAANFYTHAISKLPHLPRYINTLFSHTLKNIPYRTSSPTTIHPFHILQYIPSNSPPPQSAGPLILWNSKHERFRTP